MNALVSTTSMPLTYADIERMGASIAKSGLFGIKTADQAIALMMIAHAEGRHPALAARDYDIINGRPAKRAEAMHRDFLEAGGKIRWLALSDTEAKATFSHPHGGEVTLSWDMERATKAGFASKPNYKSYPRQMLRSRLISEGVRTVWPGATSGAHVPEEVADMDPFDGTTIDAKPEPEKPTPAKPHPMMPKGPVDPNPVDITQVQKMSWAQWAESLELAERDTPDSGVGMLLAKAEITEIYRLAKEGKPSPAKQRILDVMHRLEERYLMDPPEPNEEEEAPHIKGEENVLAG